MSRGLRCTAVWVAVSLGLAALVRATARDLLALGSPTTWAAGFDTALVPVCSAALVACAAWFWCVTTVTAVEVLRSPSPTALAGGGAARRVVLLLCGAAVASQIAVPAHAADRADDRSGGVPSLAGLAVPDRAVSGEVRRPVGRPAGEARPLARPGFADGTQPATGAAAHDVVVRPGDSLWSLAEQALGPEAGVADLVDHWHRTYAANRPVVGDDPDLIHPGQRLRLPSPDPTTHPSQSSDHEEHR